MSYYGDGIYIITSVKTNPNLQVQDFHPNHLVRKNLIPADKFLQTFWLFAWKSAEAVPSLKNVPIRRLGKKPTYTWCQWKSFSSIDFSCLFNVGSNCLISNTSAILCWNIFLWKLLPIILKSLISGDLWPVSIQCLEI